MHVRSPLRIGWKAVKANCLPMFALRVFACSMVLAYYSVPRFASILGAVADWQVKSGWRAAFLNRVLFLGALPGVFLVAVKSLRPRRVWLVLLWQSLWCGLWGVATD